MEAQVQKALDKLFPLYDINQSGAISVKCIPILLNRVLEEMDYGIINISEEQADQFFPAHTKDEDKTVSKN